MKLFKEIKIDHKYPKANTDFTFIDCIMLTDSKDSLQRDIKPLGWNGYKKMVY